MRIHNPSRAREQGGTLVAATFITIVLGFTLSSYLKFVSHQNRSVMRSMAWNSAIPILESGIEEAFSQLHFTGITNLQRNGWTLRNGYYWKENRLANGSGFLVRIEPVEPPVIVSTGVVPAPLSAVDSLEGVGSVASAALNSQGHIRRTVRVTCSRDYLFSKGMVAKGEINLNGNNIGTDSYISRTSANGPVTAYDPKNRRAHGDIASNASVKGIIDVGNADIRGTVSTGPGGSVDIAKNGSIGDVNWVNTGNQGVQAPSYVTDDMDYQFNEVTLPGGYQKGYIPAGLTTNSVTYQAYLDVSRDYSMSSLTGSVLVKAGAAARLYVSSNVSISGKDGIVIEPGAQLILYVGAATATITGQGIINQNQDTMSFQYWGLTTGSDGINTSLKVGGNGTFIGSIYAPSADFTLAGGGSDVQSSGVLEFIGASVTKTVTMLGSYNFHYDEALGTYGPKGDYIPTSWHEMQPAFGVELYSSTPVTSPSGS